MRYKTFLLRFVLLAGIVGVVLITVCLSRPAWHTVVWEGKKGSIVVAVDCPDDWQRVKRVFNFQATSALLPNEILLKRHAPSGFLGWWTRVVLHHDESAPDAAQIMVMVFEKHSASISGTPNANKQSYSIAHDTGILDDMEKIMGGLNSRPGYHTTTQRVSHPLGPALQINYDVDMALRPPTRGGKATKKETGDIWYIIPQNAPANNTEYLIISWTCPASEARSLKPVFTEIIKRVHLVKKP